MGRALKEIFGREGKMKRIMMRFEIYLLLHIRRPVEYDNII